MSAAPRKGSDLAKDVVALGALRARYNWLSDAEFRFPDAGHGLFMFEARGKNDLHVCFATSVGDVTATSDGVADGSPPYEIVIGGWDNKRSAIRKHGQQQVTVTSKDLPTSVMTPGVFEAYWINVANGHIRVGKGDAGSSVILEWVDKEPVPVSFVGVSTWDSPIQLRSLLVRPELYSTELSLTQPDFSVFLFSPTLADITFLVGEDRVSAHRIILAAWSTQLLELVRSADDAADGCVRVRDVTLRVWRAFLRYLYTVELRTFPDAADNNALRTLMREYGVPPLDERDKRRFASRGALMLASVRALPLLQSGEFADVTFDVDGHTVRAHRVVLGAWSGVFLAMFTSGLIETVQPWRAVPMPDVDWAAFVPLLAFAYTHDERRMYSVHTIDSATRTAAAGAPLPAEPNAAELRAKVLMLAQRLDMRTLAQQSISAIAECLDATNCPAIIQFASDYDFPTLVTLCLEYVIAHGDDALAQPALLDIDRTLFATVLASNHLQVCDETVVCDAVLRWAHAHADTQDEELDALLPLVRVPQLSPAQVACVSERPLLVGNKLWAVLCAEARALDNDGDALLASVSAGLQVVGDNIVITAASLAQLRVTPRTPLASVELTYSGTPGDENGVFFWIGRHFDAAKSWVNPHAHGVLVTASSPGSRYTRPRRLVSRQSNTTSYSTGRPAFWTVDLGAGNSLVCNHYLLRHDGTNSNFLRSWKLQGSVNGDSWLDLRAHVIDQTLSSPHKWGSWAVTSRNALLAFRFFRVLMSANSSNTSVLSLAQIELYGVFSHSE